MSAYIIYVAFCAIRRFGMGHFPLTRFRVFWCFPYKNGLHQCLSTINSGKQQNSSRFKEVLRPFNGHTPRKLPAFAATSRFIAYQAELLYHKKHPKSILLSIYFYGYFLRTYYNFRAFICALYTIYSVFSHFDTLFFLLLTPKFKIAHPFLIKSA